MGITSRFHVYGIDFSGAKDAGKRIWIASGVVDGEALRIDTCYRAADLPGSAVDRDRCLTALRNFIASQGDSAFGLDFPFGLPGVLVKGKRNWEDFALSFPVDYSDPVAFRKSCRERASKAGFHRELKRATDVDSKTPFSPYNWRLFRQTYYGIRDLLHPLVRDQLACVLPMQRAQSDKLWILEICPASTLKKENLPWRRYKRNTPEGQGLRVRILEGIEATGRLHIPSADLRSKILADHGGDALDSVIAALATFKALRDPAFPAVEGNDAYALEGYVYV